jgi:hypothetical protein
MLSTQARALIRVWLAFALLAPLAFAQRQPGSSPAIPPSEANHFIGTPAGWVHPKMPWGDPDLQGVWPLSYVGNTVLERCKGDQGRPGPPNCDLQKAFLTEEEHQARLAAAAKQVDRFAENARQGEAGRAFLTGLLDFTVPQRQTSLVVDPPDGRMPEMTPEGKRLMGLMKSGWPLPGETLVWDTYTDFDTWDRCITRGMPASMLPFRYNNGIRILQVPGYVILNLEMIHDARIVPLDGRAPLSGKIRQWMGESRGRWEGNTLVIETANFKAGASMVNIATFGAPVGNRFPTSDQMRITERIRRLNDDFILYEIQTEDPVVLPRSWTARFPLKLDNGFQMLEYACHEGNRMIPDWISASRAERAQQAAAKN